MLVPIVKIRLGSKQYLDRNKAQNEIMLETNPKAELVKLNPENLANIPSIGVEFRPLVKGVKASTS
jgi:hypothetical protein